VGRTAARCQIGSMRVALVLAVVATLAWVFFATSGKDCHYNAHFAKRVVCTKPDR